MLKFLFERIFFLSLSGSAALLLILAVIFLFRRHLSAKLKYRLLLPIIGDSDDDTEKDEYLLRYDMASWWIKAIIPSDCIYFKSYE